MFSQDSVESVRPSDSVALAEGVRIVDTLVITNQKGGVGKSTISALLGWWLVEKEKARVALLDLDSQKNLTRTFQQHRCDISAARLFGANPLEGNTPVDGLCLFAGETELADLERASPEIIRNFRNNGSLTLHPKFAVIGHVADCYCIESPFAEHTKNLVFAALLGH